jgi:hypothetical protein
VDAEINTTPKAMPYFEGISEQGADWKHVERREKYKRSKSIAYYHLHVLQESLKISTLNKVTISKN